MADNQETPSDINGKVHQEKGAKMDDHVDQVQDEKMESEEVQSGSESIGMTEEKSEESDKATGAEEKSPEPLSPLTSDTTSGIEVKSDPDTPPEVTTSESAKTSASSSERPSVSGTEGSSTSGIEGTSAMETESSPLAAHVETTSPTKKSKTSSFTGAIRKIISPRKKDRSHEDEATSPKDKQKSKSFLRNPLKTGKSMSPPTKSMDVSSAPVVNEETPEANTSVISPTKEGAKGAVGGKTLSPSSTSPTRKSGKKGFGSKIKKSISAIFKKTGSAEGLYMPEDAEVAAAEAAEAAASRAAQPTEEESGTPPPFPGKPGFPYWREGRLSLDEHPPSLCETQITDARSECSKFSDAFVPDLESRRESCTTEGVGSCSAAIASAILKTAAVALEAIGDAGAMDPPTRAVDSLKPFETEEDLIREQATCDLALLQNISDMLQHGSDRDIQDASDAQVPENEPSVPEDKPNEDKPDLPVTSDPDGEQNHFEKSESQEGEPGDMETKIQNH